MEAVKEEKRAEEEEEVEEERRRRKRAEEEEKAGIVGVSAALQLGANPGKHVEGGGNVIFILGWRISTY